MKVVVTGAGGFVGNAVVKALASSCEVVPTDVALNGFPGIEGDLADPDTLRSVFAGGCDAVVHLATIPGGAAEANPALAKRVNVDASIALIDAAAANGTTPRFIYASSIAAFGEQLPALVDDETPLAPKLLYGAHKAMMEQWVDTQTRRGAIDGLSLRLSAIVARPRGAAGLKSAFMSDVFHALQASEPIELPVSADATMWLMSHRIIAWNICHALSQEATGAVTLPTLRVRMANLAAAIAAFCKVDPNLATYSPDPALQAGFGSLPPIETRRANHFGFRSDGTLEELVANVLTPVNDGERA